MRLRESDIRVALEQDIKGHFGDDDTRIIHEMGLCRGQVIIDVAAVNGALHGYEIKSERDTLERLPRQAEIYSRVFDTVTIVTSGCHIPRATDLIPGWWGVIQVAAGTADEGAKLQTVREPEINATVDPMSLAQLLWREEVLELLETLGLARGFRSKPMNAVWRHLASSISLDDLKEYVRSTLKSREGWRSDSQQA